MTRTMAKGFTLIELIVVIGIIGILAALVLLAINPAELQKKGRDATRFSDMTAVRKAIDFHIANNGGPLKGDRTNIPTSFFTDSSAGTRASNTTSNYVGLDVSKFIPILPDDPQHAAGVNTMVTISDNSQVSKDEMRYYFASDGTNYEINAYLESTDNNSKALNTGDGGTNGARYEIGTAPGLDLLP